MVVALLTGSPCAGKSSVAKILNQWGWTLINLDDYLNQDKETDSSDILPSEQTPQALRRSSIVESANRSASTNLEFDCNDDSFCATPPAACDDNENLPICQLDVTNKQKLSLRLAQLKEGNKKSIDHHLYIILYVYF